MHIPEESAKISSWELFGLATTMTDTAMICSVMLGSLYKIPGPLVLEKVLQPKKEKPQMEVIGTMNTTNQNGWKNHVSMTLSSTTQVPTAKRSIGN